MVQTDTFHDLLIFGAKIEDISKPFLIGNLAMYPTYDVSKGLNGLDQNTVLMAVKSGAVFSKYKESMDSEDRFLSLSLEDAGLMPFTLFKDGWISALRIGPALDTEVRRIYQRLNAPEMQKSYAPKKYVIKQEELPRIQAIYQKLANVPEGYLESSLERFCRSYDYWIDNQLTDCIEDLVAALESIISREGDSNQQAMCLRTALLIGDNLYDRVQIQTQVKKLYEARSSLADERDLAEKDFYSGFLIADDAKNLLRAVIRASVNILGTPPTERSSALPDTMEMVIDNYLFAALHTSVRR